MGQATHRPASEAKIRGHRPQDSFRDPAERVRSWHVLQGVAEAAGVKRIEDLDDLPSGHPLQNGVEDEHLFAALAADGRSLLTARTPGLAEPARKVSLLHHLQTIPALAPAVADHEHPLWERLRPDPPPWDAMWTRIRELAPRFGLRVRDEPLDWMLYTAGFEPRHRLEWPEEDPLTLIVDPATFTSLDGVELLYALQFHAAQMGRPAQVEHFKRALRSAAATLAHRQSYHREARSTWEVLIRTRLLCAAERERPTQAELDYVRDLESVRRSRRHVVAVDPRSPRLARRARRRRQIEAIARRFDTRLLDLNVHEADDLYAWADRNRERLQAQVEFGEEAVWARPDLPPAPEPVFMPSHLLSRRRRPRQSEEEWRHWGDYLPFDFIEILPQDP